MPVQVLILRGPGTNCNNETEHAFRLAGAQIDQLHINRVVESPKVLNDYQIVCIPGGFSFGDDLGAGVLFANILREKLGDELRAFRDRDRLILGICNGFQILLKTGLLVEPTQSADKSSPPQVPVTLAFNKQGRFECRWVHVKIMPSQSCFLHAHEVWQVPVAHAEGQLFGEQSAIDRLVRNAAVAAEYVDADGRPGEFPINPNGAMGNIAGLTDETGHVFAMMPHPERHISPYQHPAWTRRKTQPKHGDGYRFFELAVGYFH